VADPTPLLELLALARLGLDESALIADAASEELPVDRLLRLGRIERHQALAARALVAQRGVSCPCGHVSLPEEAPLSCPGCGAVLSGMSVPPTPGAAAALVPGARFGPLEVQERLGSGSFGTVYRARHVALGRECALKVVPGEALAPEARARFERETEALARIQSPHVVRIHALVPVPGALAFEMELVRGETLKDRIAREGALPWREAASLVARLARGVAAAHEVGVVHRDVKPANALLGADGRVAVADFGLARVLDAATLTRSGALLGTPFYMAPEVLNGGEATARSDVYGLGAVLHEALSGEPPFRETDLARLIHRVEHGLAAPTGAPLEVDAIRARAMNPDPSRRHATALDLALALERVAAAPGASAGTRSLRALAWGLVPLLVAGALVVALSIPGADEPRHDPAARWNADRAIAVLTSPGGTERGRALATLLSAAAQAKPGLGAELDRAVARAPFALELEAVRARLAVATKAPLAASDLAASSACGLAVDDLVEYALRSGIEGRDALAAVRGLAAARPSSRGLAELEGVVACASGDPSCRAEALSALVRARPSSAGGVALLRALELADALARALEKGGPVPSLAQRLGLEAAAVARTPGLERALAVVLDPVARTVLELWRGLHADLATERENLRALLGLLTDLDERAPPLLVALRAVLLAADPAGEARFSENLGLARVAAVARGIRDEEPLLAAAALDAAARRASEPLLERLPALDLADECLALAGRRSTRDAERSTATLTARRLAEGRALVEEALALEGADARKHLGRALAARERALAIARESELLTQKREDDARAVLADIFALDETAAWEGPAREIGNPALRDALAAEVKRRSGDPAGARALAMKAVEEDAQGAPDPLAVLALADADLGALAGAREILPRLTKAETRAPPVVRAFSVARVEAYLEAREAKK